MIADIRFMAKIRMNSLDSLSRSQQVGMIR